MNAPSLTGFLAMTEANFRLFDLSLSLRKLPNNTLEKLDEGQPYLMPHMGFAWLVIFMWNPELKEQNSLWFMRLPLDEQGILNAAAHSDLVSRLYKSLQTADPKERQRLLTEHPYQFKPDTQKMAALHATATKILGLPASHHFQSAADFYRQTSSNTDWATLGIQGIADFVVRLKEEEFEALNAQLRHYPNEAFIALASQLENRVLSTSTVQALFAIASAGNVDIETINACLRAVGQSPAIRLFDNLATTLVTEEQASLETILILLTRYRHLLEDTKSAAQLLDALASKADADGFNRVVANLAMQQDMSGIVMRILGSEHLTETLANALSGLLMQTKRTDDD